MLPILDASGIPDTSDEHVPNTQQDCDDNDNNVNNNSKTDDPGDRIKNVRSSESSSCRNNSDVPVQFCEEMDLCDSSPSSIKVTHDTQNVQR